MLIQVTQSHIARGTRHDFTACPIALALYDALGDNLDRYVLDDIFNVHLPEQTIDWMCQYDMGAIVLPIDFELDYQPMLTGILSQE